MATDSNGNGLNVKTAFGEIAARGPNVMLVILLFGVSGLALFEHHKRSEEHSNLAEQLELNREVVVQALKFNDCLNRLAIYQGLQPRGTINWRDMPPDLYSCMPKFMWKDFERKSGVRGE